MRYLVVEIKNGYAALLSDDGCVLRIRNKNYQIGQEVDFNMFSGLRSKMVSVAAAALFLVVVGGGYSLYKTPVNYVSLDVNPSIDYTVNCFDVVLSAKGVNDDGTDLLEGIDPSKLKNKNIEKAMDVTIEQIAKKGYLESDESRMVITTYSKNSGKAKKLANKLKVNATASCKKQNCTTSVEAESAGIELVKEARKLGVTPGKLNLVKKLVESSEDGKSVDMNEWLNKSVKDIMAQTKKNKELNRSRQQNKTSTVNQEMNQNQEQNGKWNNRNSGNINKQNNSNGKGPTANGDSNSGQIQTTAAPVPTAIGTAGQDSEADATTTENGYTGKNK